MSIWVKLEAPWILAYFYIFFDSRVDVKLKNLVPFHDIQVASNKMELNMEECERHTPQGFLLIIRRNDVLGMWWRSLGQVERLVSLETWNLINAIHTYSSNSRCCFLLLFYFFIFLYCQVKFRTYFINTFIDFSTSYYPSKVIDIEVRS